MYNLLVQVGCQTPHYYSAQSLVICTFSLLGVIEAIKGQCHEIFCFRFYHESSFPKPLKITLGSFHIFSEIHRDIRNSRCTAFINDNSEKFSTGVNYAGGKVATGFNGGGMAPIPLVLLILVVN
jgi:hypothetical protein